MIINAFEFTKDLNEFTKNLTIETIKLEKESSDKFNSVSMWNNQQIGFDILTENNRAQLVQPPGSGKSITVSFSLAYKLKNNTNLKAIIVVPQSFISKSFGKMRLLFDGKISTISHLDNTKNTKEGIINLSSPLNLFFLLFNGKVIVLFI